MSFLELTDSGTVNAVHVYTCSEVVEEEEEEIHYVHTASKGL